MRSLLEYTSYRSYLTDAFELLAKTKKGIRSRFAEALSCRPGFITQVFDGTMNLSADQASLASTYLGHTDLESEYFLLLVLRERAGTPQLRTQLDRQLKTYREKHLDLKERFKVDKKLTAEDEILFYSSWHYLAILTLISIPEFQTKEKIAERLGLTVKKTSEALEKLLASDLIRVKNGRYVGGEMRTHLPKDSPLVSKHHLNWRLRAMQSIEKGSNEDFHYSSVVSISEKDRDLIKALVITMLEKAASIIAPSPEEKVCSFNIDFFEL